MTVITKNIKRSGRYLGESAALNIVNEEIIVSSGSGVLNPGRLLKVSGTEMVPAAAADTAIAGILFHAVDATAADVKSVATVNGPATINGNLLEFAAGITGPQKAAQLAALRAKGLKVLPQHAA